MTGVPTRISHNALIRYRRQIDRQLLRGSTAVSVGSLDQPAAGAVTWEKRPRRLRSAPPDTTHGNSRRARKRPSSRSAARSWSSSGTCCLILRPATTTWAPTSTTTASARTARHATTSANSNPSASRSPWSPQPDWASPVPGCASRRDKPVVQRARPGYFGIRRSRSSARPGCGPHSTRQGRRSIPASGSGPTSWLAVTVPSGDRAGRGVRATDGRERSARP